MKKTIIIGTIAALLVIPALVFAASSNRTEPVATEQTVPSPAPAPSVSNDSPAPETAADNTPTPQPASPGYVDYASSAPVPADRPYRVLFFKADWCYTCTGLHKDIEANGSAIPADVQIARVDYDKETALKQKYDVRQQHSFVQIDANGNVVKKWVLSPTLQDVAAQIERS